jgi:nitroimidazol reductase NimA-like FMN-containing flavoprotein (pyridoxamine 5'-phosphate oxidase superfamily)
MGSPSNTGQYVVEMEALDHAMCWRLISRTRFGRIGFVVDGRPGLLPVNCGVLSRQVVFRTGAETTLGAMADGRPAVFETDYTDEVAEEGWSVVVKGHISLVTDADEFARLAELDLHPWAPGVKDRWMKIVPTEVTGRVVGRHHLLPRGREVPYMSAD